MRSVMTAIAVSAIVIGAGGAPSTAQEELKPAQAKVRELGRQYTEQFYAKQLDGLVARFTREMAEAMSAEKFAGVRQQLDEQLGAETEMLSEAVESKDGYLVYLRRARFEKFPGVVEVRWAMKEGGAIAGVFLTPEK